MVHKNALTIRELKKCIDKLVKLNPEILDKGILLSDDDEGNGYHICWYTIDTNTQDLAELIYDVDAKDLKDYVILG